MVAAEGSSDVPQCEQPGGSIKREAAGLCCRPREYNGGHGLEGFLARCTGSAWPAGVTSVLKPIRLECVKTINRQGIREQAGPSGAWDASTLFRSLEGRQQGVKELKILQSLAAVGSDLEWPERTSPTSAAQRQ
ncbi:hypothetical protein NDU88_007654 [Pleurodeles waltl]|uniref:Uncharacterized protein n=1 Tax=Pleurodeles waltl TaxID=8319 RepID=A0AAV7N2M9_PLEWA|nr:hypothetical protein NDU88_007654 [Pleurodeles waltl]